jgi:hypothetical protein
MPKPAAAFSALADEIYLMLIDDRRQAAAYDLAPGFADDVADEEYAHAYSLPPSASGSAERSRPRRYEIVMGTARPRRSVSFGTVMWSSPSVKCAWAFDVSHEHPRRTARANRPKSRSTR